MGMSLADLDGWSLRFVTHGRAKQAAQGAVAGCTANRGVRSAGHTSDESSARPRMSPHAALSTAQGDIRLAAVAFTIRAAPPTDEVTIRVRAKRVATI